MVQLRDAKSVTDAVDVVRAAGGPPLNVILADDQGHVAYAVCGRIPATDQISATSIRTYISAQDLPHVIDPACEYVANANNRLVELVKELNELKRQKVQFETQLEHLVDSHKKLLDS